jgi:aminomethyltransferase
MTIVEGGQVTSGSHSPMLERGIGMGYVPARLAQAGAELTIDVRGRQRRGRTVKKPIYSREEPNGG